MAIPSVELESFGLATAGGLNGGRPPEEFSPDSTFPAAMGAAWSEVPLKLKLARDPSTEVPAPAVKLVDGVPGVPLIAFKSIFNPDCGVFVELVAGVEFVDEDWNAVDVKSDRPLEVAAMEVLAVLAVADAGFTPPNTSAADFHIVEIRVRNVESCMLRSASINGAYLLQSLGFVVP